MAIWSLRNTLILFINKISLFSFSRLIDTTYIIFIQNTSIKYKYPIYINVADVKNTII